ncbi:MAG: azurin [Pseudomonadota bacterium]
MTNQNIKLSAIAATVVVLIGCSGEQAKAAPKAAEAAETVAAAAAPAAAMAAEAADDAAAAMDKAPTPEAVAGGAGAATAAGAAGAAEGDAAGGDSDCAFTLEVGDALAFNTKEIVANKSCGSFTVTLTHTGNLPAAAMGHNFVLVPMDATQAVANAALKVTAAENYVPDDDRVIANSKIVGGGESTSVTFDISGLSGDYRYMCTFPGHWVAMQGVFRVNG